MENKKLLKILVNDLSELEELVDEKGATGFDTFEMEFVRARVKGAKRLLQILYNNENPVEKELKKKPVLVVEKEIEVEKMEENLEVREEIKEEPPKEEIKEEKIVEDVQKKIQVVETEIVKKDEPSPVENKNEVQLEEEAISESSPRLGDSFLKEKSLNDLLYDQNNLEFKLSNRPVSSIKSAIGINDRFQYIRELFDGNGDKFAETVATIDEMKNINEAVEYLRQSFKWKKNDTSLKFVGLVKRRFSND
ncbi:MAG: hypothetical protein HN778_04540 [Prolixibacteraceae bacterium]|jgi:hypothetical protein|nr:hypothetical protein [Prolixibacteraceae bacterium]MBT6007191.1 hypothetical protein [Prolixibacteraceae bacterium]MBT6765804.1 hypothetical protein [Prolixibacteraceae bacterium]MBT6999697.1 hypothetical protein [Prolixibacteraceae bacterium]MBT7394084.1 hypothetical protein [Prolixibacteraceae bacterium]